MDHLSIRTDYPADCNDLSAQARPGGTEGPAGNPTCSDGLDNNCDGLLDAADPGCAQTFMKVSKVATSASSGNLDCKKVGNSRRGEATVTVVNRTTLAPIAGAVVTGNWKGAAPQIGVTATTNAGGNAVFTSLNGPAGSIFTFTVTNVTHTPEVYDPASNNETSDSTPACN